MDRLQFLSTTWLAAWDPGKTTGRAEFDKNGILLRMDQLSITQLDELEPATIPVFVYEKYTVYPDKLAENIMKENVTEQAIGVILRLGRKSNARIVAQQANIKRTAEKWSGVTAKNVPHSASHSIDAFNHGIYWLVQNKIISIQELRGFPKPK